MTGSRFRFNLLTRTLLALGAVGLLPLALASTQLISLNRDAMRDQVLQTHILAVRTVAEGIDGFLTSRRTLAEGIAASPAFADPVSTDARRLLGQSLQAWSRLGVLAIAVVNEQGGEVIRAQRSGAGVAERVTASLAQSTDSGVRELTGERPPLLLFSQPLQSAAGRIVLISESVELARTVEPREIGADAQLAVINADGALIFGSVTTLETFPDDQVESALDRSSDGAKSFARADGGSQLGAWSFVGEASWSVLSIQPGEVAEAVALEMRRNSIIAVVGALALIALLAVFAYGSVVRPIRRLAAAQRRLAKLPAAGGGDEIEQLRSSFEALERNLKDREALDTIFLGRYQVVKVLGAGAMGTVFRGWDPKLKRPVALKTVRLGTEIPDEKRKELIDRLLDEAVTVARFNHPHIVSVYDVEDLPDAAFVAMELIDGISVESLLFRRRSLEPDRAALIALAIADALAAAHDAGVVHRDIKPANVLLGNQGSIKVTDFGISELISAATRGSNTVFGTPGYLPPETLEGTGYTHQGDLFALGVVMYLSLTGARPFEGRDVREIIRRTMFASVPPPSTVKPAIHPELEALVLDLLSKKPEDRPANAREVVDRLREIADSEGYRWFVDWPVEEPEVAATPTTRLSQLMPTTKLTVHS